MFLIENNRRLNPEEASNEIDCYHRKQPSEENTVDYYFWIPVEKLMKKIVFYCGA